MLVNFDIARQQIQEGDVLLFRAGKFPSFGWWITSYTRGIHSHAAIAHVDNGNVFCVEMREFKGGRSVTLESQILENPGVVDVYRVTPHICLPLVNEDGSVTWSERHFGNDIARKITDKALSLTGSDYGWKNIWGIFKGYAPGFRLLNKPKGDNDIPAEVYVCSTLVAASYRKHYVDLCPNLSDERTTPADLAQSSMLNYIFTIE